MIWPGWTRGDRLWAWGERRSSFGDPEGGRSGEETLGEWDVVLLGKMAVEWVWEYELAWAWAWVAVGMCAGSGRGDCVADMA